MGSGLRWGEVYNQLDDFNVTVVGGRVLDVGVGGLILGGMHLHASQPRSISERRWCSHCIGGLSYLSDIYGLVCDNVVNFEASIALFKPFDIRFTRY